MESNTHSGRLFDLGSLYAYLQTLNDTRKARGKRYALALILLSILLAKLCGESHPSGIADWAAQRADLLLDLLRLKRKKMLHHSTYRRILSDVVNVEELESMSSAFLSGKKCLGSKCC